MIVANSDRRALFAVSLNRQDYSTLAILPALMEIDITYKEVVFLIADHLQIYNVVLRAGGEPPLGQIIRNFGKSDYLAERSAWITRMLKQIPREQRLRSWKIVGIDYFSDVALLGIFRNVMLAYYESEDLRRDVDATAETHARSGNNNPGGQRCALSRGYLLEELAVSIRAHVVDDLHDEYYVGTQPLHVLNLYNGCYPFSAYDLAQYPTISGVDRFFTWDSKSDTPSWRV